MIDLIPFNVISILSVRESTEPVPNIWPIITERAVRAVSRAMVSNAGAHHGSEWKLLLPASPQAGEASSLTALSGQVNAASVVLLLLHWPLTARWWRCW